MLKAKKDNAVYKITEKEKDFYAGRGFEIFDEKGNALEKPEKAPNPQEVKALKERIKELEKTVKALEAENKALKSDNEKLKAQAPKPDEKGDNNGNDSGKSNGDSK